jgi:histidyl-tRNA synthetase
MKLLNVKGCNDYLASDQIVRNYINDKLKETFEEFGYMPIETPILMYYNVLSGKYDSNNDLLKEIYKLSDQGKRELGLRYDLTVPFAKFIALNKNKITLPFKRYEISKVFRDGPIKLGRDREFTQCDVDVVGIEGQMIEAECLSLYVNAFNKLGIEIDIQYNSRNLMRGLILSCDIKKEKINTIVTIIDKMDKLSRDEFKTLLLDNGLDYGQIDSLMSLFNLSLKELKDRYKDTDIRDLKDGIEELVNLEKYINSLNLDKYCSFTPTLARGQDYYTGCVFEVYEKNRKLNCSIGGGGRYDKMITNYIDDGNIYPAVGISFGLSSIFELLKNSSIFQEKSLVDIYIVPLDTKIEAMKLANNLRSNGIKVLVEMNKKKVGKALSWADKNSIPYVIVIGENEINTGKIEIRDMINSTNIEMDMNNIKEIIKILH